MRIAIDTQAALMSQPTGLSVYTKHLRTLLEQMQDVPHSFSFYDPHHRKGGLKTPERLYWENIELPQRVRKDQCDLLHVPAFAPSFRKPCPLVVTVHDLIGMTFPNQISWPSRLYWGRWLPAAIRGADKLIADSAHTKRDIVRLLGVSETKVTVIYPSGHEGFSPTPETNAADEIWKKHGIHDNYFLAVGTLEPRKNLRRILDAFMHFCGSSSNRVSYQLVLVGSQQFAHGVFYEKLKAQYRDRSKLLIFTGYVEQPELNLLYARAAGFIFPSLYEGFGIPVLEAMASGTPVLTASTSSLPEVAGDAALYVDPEDPSEIARGLAKLAHEPSLREDLIGRGFERIKLFAWSKMVRQIVDVYESFSCAYV